MKAYVFPGQGAQFTGMGKDLYDESALAKEMFGQANEILGFDITNIMFNGTPEELKETKVTQPAIFMHSCILAKSKSAAFNPNMVAGHSLGEISAMVASNCLTFEDGLKLVSKRALAMQAACESQSSTMAAILGMEDEKIEELCKQIDGVVVPANYNCPGQLVISGETEAVNAACELMKEAGAKRALVLPVGGAFHSPLMDPAKNALEDAIANTKFSTPSCPIYQNVTAKAENDPAQIKENLIAQLTAPVRWTETMKNMIADGANEIIEVGPGKVLQGLFRKIDRALDTRSL